MRILLVQPGLQADAFGHRGLALLEPLGLESAAGGLEDEHEVLLLDLRIRNDLAEMSAWFRPDICGINCSFTVDVYRCLSVAQTVKASANGRPPFVVVGGHHASLRPADFGHRSVDAVAVGEGEHVLPSLVACLEQGGDVSRVPGLVINASEHQMRTGLPKAAENLDDLPLPARGLTRPQRASYFVGFDRPVAIVETARGCPYRCKFCSVWRFYRGQYRTKSASRVAEEVAAIDEPFVIFGDDNFLADPEHAREIALSLLRKGLRRHYTFQARSDSVVDHPDIVDLWRDAGLAHVFLGLEKADDAELAAVNKRNSVATNERALEVLRRARIGTTGSFIVDPDWEHSDFATLRQYVTSHRISTPSFTVLTPLPGTILHHQVRSRLETLDYELYDLLHAVVATRLPLREFYSELAQLYRSAYLQERVVTEQIVVMLRRLISGNISLSHLRQLIGVAARLTVPECYMTAHGAPAMGATNAEVSVSVAGGGGDPS